jgi:tetratricopeptide (TPR) repeat protein
VALAEAYAQSGETFGAIQQLQIAIKLGDNSEATALRLADLDTEAGQAEDAASVLAVAAARPHPTKTLLMALARTRLDLGDFQGAADAVAPLADRTAELSSQEQQLLARTFLLAGDAERAEQWIPAAAQDPEWLALAGLKEMLLGHAPQAESWLSRSVTQNPTDGWNAYLLGRAALLAGDAAKAQAAWNAAVRLQGAPPQAFIGLARLLLSTGQVHEVDRLLSGVAPEGRFDPAYWQAEAELAHARHLPGVEQIARGYAALNAGDPWKAEAVWIAALPGASDADARALYEAIINSAFRRQDSDVSLHYAKAATTRWPNDPLFLRKYGEILLGNNQLPQALAVATQLRQVTPPDKEAEADDLLGRIALDSGRGDLVTQFTARYRTLAPTNPTPLLQLAEWQVKADRSQENLERTLKLYQEAASLAPQNAEAQAHVGILLFDLKRTAEATQALLHALTLSPRVLDGTPDVLLAQLYQQQGLTLEANVHNERYRHLRAMKDAWPPLMKAMRQERPERDWLALGAAALDGHEDWIALCAFHQSTQRAPQDPVAWRSLAEAQKRFGQFEQALEAMRKAHLLTPKSRH